MFYAPRFEQAKAFLDANLSGPKGRGTGVFIKPEGPFVTISREAGSGSTALAEHLANRLNSDPDNEGSPWAVFDQNLVEKVLADEHLSPRIAKFLPEAKVSELDASVGEILGLHPNLWELIRQTVDLMRKLAKHGNVILIGRGANFATARIKNGVHVRLVAPLRRREAHIAEVLDVPLAEARNHAKKLDARRRDFVRSLFNTDIANPTAYDFVLNTARVPVQEAGALIAQTIPRPVQTS